MGISTEALRQVADLLDRQHVPQDNRIIGYLGVDGEVHYVREGERLPCPPCDSQRRALMEAADSEHQRE